MVTATFDTLKLLDTLLPFGVEAVILVQVVTYIRLRFEVFMGFCFRVGQFVDIVWIDRAHRSVLI
jgi:hypothetical protein